MDRADPRAGEHRHRRLQDHRQVESDAVALLHAERFEAVRHANDLGMKLTIRKAPRHARRVGLPQERDLVGPLGQMSVDAIVAEVEDAVLVPAYVDRIERPIAGLGRRYEPIEQIGRAHPEHVRFLNRMAIERLILLRTAMATLYRLGRRGYAIGDRKSDGLGKS